MEISNLQKGYILYNEELGYGLNTDNKTNDWAYNIEDTTIFSCEGNAHRELNDIIDSLCKEIQRYESAGCIDTVLYLEEDLARLRNIKIVKATKTVILKVEV